MADNPYAAPHTTDLVRPQQWSAGSGTFTIGQCWNDAWQAATKNVGLVIVGFIVAVLAAFAMSATFIGYFIGLPVLAVGVVRFGLELLDGNTRIGTLFSGFSAYTKFLGRMLLLFLLLFLLSLPGSVLQLYATYGDQGLLFLGLVVSFFWSIVVMPRFVLASFFAVDADRPAVDAVRNSWQMTGPVWLKMVLLSFVTSIVGMSGIVLLGVGVIFTAPLAGLMYASAYRQLAGRPAPVA